MLVQIGTATPQTPFVVEKANPMYALVYVEHKCHLKCQHCYESEETHPTRHQITLAQYKDLFRQLKALGVLNLTISGGEAFLRRDLLDIVAEARRQRFYVSLFTSGTLLNEKKVQRLKELKVGRVEVSLYSPKSEIHDRFTQIPGSHKRTEEGIRLLVKAGIPTTVKVGVMTFNVDDLVEMKKWVNGLGADFLLSPNLFPKMNGNANPLEFQVPAQEMAEKVLNQPYLNEVVRDLNFYDEQCTGDNHYLGNWDNKVCGAASKGMAVDALGDVFPCAVFPVAAGNIFKQSLQEIWDESSLMNRVRTTTYRDFHNNGCSSCDHQNLCHPCQAYGVVENQDHLGCSTDAMHQAKARQAHWDLLRNEPNR